MWGGLAARSWAGFCQDGCQPCGSASGHRHRGRAHGKDVLFFFFALDNFYLPAPEGLLMTPTKPHTWGPCVPVNEGTIKGSVVELGCGGKWGAGEERRNKRGKGKKRRKMYKERSSIFASLGGPLILDCPLDLLQGQLRL